MVLIGAILGFRWSEIAGLRLGSIESEHRALEVMETVTSNASGQWVSSRRSSMRYAPRRPGTNPLQVHPEL